MHLLETIEYSRKFHASARHLADKKEDDRALAGEVEGEEQLQDTPKVPSIF